MDQTVAVAQRHIRVVVDLEPLTDLAHRFVTAAWPRTESSESLGDLGASRNRFVPIPVLEQMVLAGVTRREDVAAFITACFPADEFDVR